MTRPCYDVASHICGALHKGGPQVHRVASKPPAQRRGRAAGGPGKAVLVDTTKPTLKAPGIKRLKLTRDKPHLSFTFNPKP
jgi:hypothetical protein